MTRRTTEWDRSSLNTKGWDQEDLVSLDEIVGHLKGLTVQRAELVEIDPRIHNVDVSHSHDQDSHGGPGHTGGHDQDETVHWVVAFVSAHRPPAG